VPAESRVFSKITWRLMPLLIAGYVFNYLDRNNVGFAALTMNRAIGLSATEFGRVGGMFFVGYCFFELPSNIALYRVGPRVWLARIMISWGVISAATIFATGATTDDTGTATMNHAIMRVRYSAGNQLPR
jgi:ACS family tartrate transporter-like MFS transporter